MKNWNSEFKGKVLTMKIKITLQMRTVTKTFEQKLSF